MTGTANLPINGDDSAAMLDRLFFTARSLRSFASTPVADETLQQMWELARWGPTSSNGQPARIVHVRSAEGKARLLPLVDERNQPKVLSAPVTTIVAADSQFHHDLPELYAPGPGLREMYEANGIGARRSIADFNAALQAGYLIMAARAVGLSVGPMGGFDAQAVAAEFLDPSRERALVLVNLGYAPAEPEFPRLPRLSTDRVVRWE